jgi:MoaA/NifB/PqqE/SkfB family radical SAM enzyme
MDFIRAKTNIKLRVNSLVSKMNLEDFEKLARVIDKYDVERWKLFKFTPLRGKAIESNTLFEITDKQYLEATSTAQKNAPNTRVVVCINTNLEEDYLLINPVGDFIVTKDQKDEKICNYKNIDLGKLEEILKS